MMNSSIEERGMLYLGFHSRTQGQMAEVQISRVVDNGCRHVSKGKKCQHDWCQKVGIVGISVLCSEITSSVYVSFMHCIPPTLLWLLLLHQLCF